MIEKRPADILIVEDVDTMRDLLAQVVGGLAGLHVSGLARNSWEARLELSRRRPALVLLDEILPGESSTDLLSEMLEQGIPVLLLTGLSEPTHPVAAGALGRLIKPGWDTLEADSLRFQAAIMAALNKSPKSG
jgi:response regulator of citrate/malate metabolism